MIKNSLKKVFIKISRLLGFEIIDQNSFVSPTLNKELNENLSEFNKKSIVLPLGEVEIKRKIESLLIIFRTNSNIGIWDQNKKRIFEQDKIIYVEKSLNSLIKSIKFAEQNLSNIVRCCSKWFVNSIIGRVVQMCRRQINSGGKTIQRAR